MNKEQIQQKFDEMLNGHGYKFWTDGQLKTTGHLIKKDFIELMEFAFNLGLEIAADNAEADYTMIGLGEEIDIEVYVIKNSILKLKI